MISAKAEVEELDPLEELELDPEVPRPPAVVPEEPLEVEPEEDPVEDALEVDPAETESPGERLARDTIVPLDGAWSLVSARAVSALLTLASAL
jgi:hypothetical protein